MFFVNENVFLGRLTHRPVCLRAGQGFHGPSAVVPVSQAVLRYGRPRASSGRRARPAPHRLPPRGAATPIPHAINWRKRPLVPSNHSAQAPASISCFFTGLRRLHPEMFPVIRKHLFIYPVVKLPEFLRIDFPCLFPFGHHFLRLAEKPVFQRPQYL